MKRGDLNDCEHRQGGLLLARVDEKAGMAAANDFIVLIPRQVSKNP